MKTQERTKPETGILRKSTSIKSKMSSLLLALAFMFIGISGYAHCDSYDGPVIKDALKALDQNNVELVLKWIEPKQEKEIISLFDKTYHLKNGDQEVYSIVEKHFFETLVRLHRETEGERYAMVAKLNKTKDQSVKQGRKYVEAYVKYTHTLEALENLLHVSVSHSGGGHAEH